MVDNLVSHHPVGVINDLLQFKAAFNFLRMKPGKKLVQEDFIVSISKE